MLKREVVVQKFEHCKKETSEDDNALHLVMEQVKMVRSVISFAGLQKHTQQKQSMKVLVFVNMKE